MGFGDPPGATGGLGVASRCRRGRGVAAQSGAVLGDMRQQLEEREHALQLARDTIQVSASQIPAPGAIPGGHGDSPGGHMRHWPGPLPYSRFSQFSPIPPFLVFSCPSFPVFPGFFLSLIPGFSIFPLPGFSFSSL